MTSNEHDSEPSLVEYSVTDGVATIALNRPAKLNAFTDDMVLELKAALDRFDADPDARVAILKGNGRAFSTGADVLERQLRPREELIALGGPAAPAASSHPILYEFVNWKPVIASLHGYVLGMALGIAIKCEIIVAAAGTQMQVTEISRGLFAGTYWSIFQWRVGGTVADRIFFEGAIFTAEQALDWGLIHEVAEPDQLDAVASAWAHKIMELPPLAVQALVRSRRWTLESLERDHKLVKEAWKLHLTDDFRARAQAFADRDRGGPTADDGA